MYMFRLNLVEYSTICRKISITSGTSHNIVFQYYTRAFAATFIFLIVFLALDFQLCSFIGSTDQHGTLSPPLYSLYFDMRDYEWAGANKINLIKSSDVHPNYEYEVEIVIIC